MILPKIAPHKSDRVEIIDYLRVVATFGVLFIHLSGWFLIQKAEPRLFYAFLANSSRYAVPMFVFISAALFYFKYTNVKKIDRKKYYIGRIKNIVIPFFAVSVVYYIYRMSPLVSPKVKIALPALISIKYFLKMVFTIGIFSHLYFVPAILMFYFLAPALLKFYKKNKILFVVLLGAINMAFVYYMLTHEVVRIYWRWTIFPYLTYISFGFLFADYYKKIKGLDRKYIGILLIATLYFITLIYNPYNSHQLQLAGLSSYLYDTLFGIFWILFFLLVKFPPTMTKVVTYFSDKSFGVYLFHYMIIDCFFALIVRGYINPPLNFLSYVALLGIIIVISSALYYLVEKGIEAIYRAFNSSIIRRYYVQK